MRHSRTRGADTATRAQYDSGAREVLVALACIIAAAALYLSYIGAIAPVIVE